MRRKMVAGNWKMHGSLQANRALLGELVAAPRPDCELAVCVPFVGFGVGLLLALLAGALQFQSLYALGAVAVVYGIGQVVESSWLTPRLLGHHIGLHPLLVIFLLLAFGSLFGFIGVLLALPAGALLLVLARHALAWYRSSALFLGS